MDSLEEIGSCVQETCPDVVDCKWTQWSVWSGCVPAEGTCGIGFKWRNRDIEDMPRNGGQLCAPRIKEEVLPVEGCQGQEKCCIDGAWGEWAAWDECTATCGVGTKARRRMLSVAPTWCGLAATGPDSEFVQCEVGKCAVDADCTFSDWSTPTVCSSACRGHLSKTRTIVQNSTGAGKGCNGLVEAIEECNPAAGAEEPPACAQLALEAETKKDCLLSLWSEWTACSATCQVGSSTRMRTILTKPQNGGLPCDTDLRVVESCHVDMACFADRVNCEWQGWTAWDTSSCLTTGSMARTRGYLTMEQNGGIACAGPLEESASCGNQCVVGTYECAWGAWSDWTPCPTECDNSAPRIRSRLLEVSELTIEADPEAGMAIGSASAIDDATSLHSAAKPAELAELAGLSTAQGARPSELAYAFALGCTAFITFGLVYRAVSSRRSSSSSRWLLPEYTAISQE